MKIRLALCGHTVPSHPGRQRVECNDCDPSWAARRAEARGSRECKTCGTEFNRASATYCSDACRPSAHRRSQDACSRCGTPLPSRRRRFCSAECRYKARYPIVDLPDRVCALDECKVVFKPCRDGHHCCSERHGRMLWNRRSRADGRQVTVWNDKRRDNYHRRRARKKGAQTEGVIHLGAVGFRDGWRCGVCRKAVDRMLSWPHPLSPSLDHIIPLSTGGIHASTNVRLAHLRCNIRRGNRAESEQMFLFG